MRKMFTAKRLFAYCATVVCLGAMASCQKAEIKENGPEPERIKLNVQISEPPITAETKAAKKSWSTGDKINLYFDGWSATATATTPPDLVLTYNGTKWEAGTFAEGRAPLSNGVLCGFYEGYNDLNKYHPEWYSNTIFYWGPNLAGGIGGTNIYSIPLLLCADNINYTFASNTLTANFNLKAYTKVKFLIKNLPSTTPAEEFFLTVKNTSTNIEAEPFGSINVTIYNSVTRTSHSQKGTTAGVPESDGVAFYYDNLEANSANISFALTNKEGTLSKSYTVTGKTIPDNDLCKGYVLDFNNFE